MKDDDDFDDYDLISDYLVDNGFTPAIAFQYYNKVALIWREAENLRLENGFTLTYNPNGENSVFGHCLHSLIHEINNPNVLMAFIDDKDKFLKYAYNFLKHYSITEHYVGGKLNLKLSDKTKKMMKNVGT